MRFWWVQPRSIRQVSQVRSVRSGQVSQSAGQTSQLPANQVSQVTDSLKTIFRTAMSFYVCICGTLCPCFRLRCLVLVGKGLGSLGELID